MAGHKALKGVEIKDASKGIVEAVFSRFDVIDHDGDVTRKDAFEDRSPVRISAYGHASWGPSRSASSVPMPPVGRGEIRVGAKEAVMQGRFFLNTANGHDTFELIKEMGDLQEWSYGYDVIESEKGEFDGEKVLFLNKLVVHEVSPVLLGAGIGTRTLAVKGKQLDSDLRSALDSAGRSRFGGDNVWAYLDDFDLDANLAVYAISADDGETRFMQVGYTRDDDGNVTLADDETEVRRSIDFVPKSRAPFSEQADGVLGDARDLLDRAKTFGSQSTELKEGRALSASNRDRLAQLAESLTGAAAELEQLLADSDPNKHRDVVLREFARFERLRSQAI